MKIDGREIGSLVCPYIVAEISANHCGSLDHAKQLIRTAKWAGADAVKFQCYEPGEITLDCDNDDFRIKSGPWASQTLFALYSKACTPRAWFPDLFATARECGISAFASVFSPDGVDYLESLGCPAYKIASMELVDAPLIEHAAKTGKPVIISTGMGSMKEIRDALVAAESYMGVDALPLHCVSGYPTDVDDADLGRLISIQNEMGDTGISDHTLGWEVPVAAVALGAVMIEKHFILSRDLVSEDREFSLEPGEFKTMVDKVRQIWRAMQPPRHDAEADMRQFRRSLYAVADIKAGEPFTAENIRSIRPGYGMTSSELPRLLSAGIASCDIKRGTALNPGMVVDG